MRVCRQDTFEFLDASMRGGRRYVKGSGDLSHGHPLQDGIGYGPNRRRDLSEGKAKMRSQLDSGRLPGYSCFALPAAQLATKQDPCSGSRLSECELLRFDFGQIGLRKVQTDQGLLRGILHHPVVAEPRPSKSDGADLPKIPTVVRQESPQRRLISESIRDSRVKS